MESGKSRSAPTPRRPYPSPARNARHGLGRRCQAMAAGSAFLLLTVKHGEPDRRLGRVGPLDAVPAMRRDLQPVAGTKKARLCLVLEAQPGRTGQQQNPFGLVLVVPEAFG